MESSQTTEIMSSKIQAPFLNTASDLKNTQSISMSYPTEDVNGRFRLIGKPEVRSSGMVVTGCLLTFSIQNALNAALGEEDVQH
jgi:hypothetical protein